MASQSHSGASHATIVPRGRHDIRCPGCAGSGRVRWWQPVFYVIDVAPWIVLALVLLGVLG